MGGSEPLCPACGQALRATEISGVRLRVCGQCHGTLLGQIDMIRTLEAMSAELLATVDPDVELTPVGKAAGKVACPACGRDMARDDYCSAGLAHFDRCEPCRLLWLGADALGTMTHDVGAHGTATGTDPEGDPGDARRGGRIRRRLLLGRATRRALMRFL